MVSMMAVVRGTSRLSSMGVGRDSTVIPAAAAMKALKGVVNRVEPRKAKMKPDREPSRFLALLNG